MISKFICPFSQFMFEDFHPYPSEKLKALFRGIKFWWKLFQALLYTVSYSFYRSRADICSYEYIHEMKKLIALVIIFCSGVVIAEGILGGNNIFKIYGTSAKLTFDL